MLLFIFPVQEDSKPIYIDLDLYLLSKKQLFQRMFASYVMLKELITTLNLKMFRFDTIWIL